MWHVMVFARTYAPYIMFPVAFTIGFIGYNIEKKFRKTESFDYLESSVIERRQRRLLEETLSTDPTIVASLRTKQDVPKSSLDRNPTSTHKNSYW
ncbi:Small integral membrane protein 12-B [Trichinella nelsoni]|nr:Small integral membrane protein 12-B [Trichinella nelsoni]KRX38931.1 Small integral membrane protein 12-B [Trichinella murrelli]KRX59769.1 Small integral membrane protein 12-B [Trichinella sp. T9]KRX72547.1 Small integral membrane protein 12-B [Trichinella sp. T6]KRY17158.1 Small integral membrane protein 12-B [Trichinella patagoniensis]KRY48436.1 Small integral membrane protein 12-B [Trichinella britovi]KRZ55508.1 Small integral membrane protein 12-B [Trichinella nativa]KRZ85107.1 Small 